MTSCASSRDRLQFVSWAGPLTQHSVKLCFSLRTRAGGPFYFGDSRGFFGSTRERAGLS